MADYMKLARTLLGVARDVLNDKSRGTRKRPQRRPDRPRARFRQQTTTGYPGDFPGCPTMSYAPIDDHRADPGEVVWTWVPFEEDHTRGKDRPVLIIGRDEPWLLALQLTSQDHDRDAAQEAAAGRYWIDIGSGDWDRAGQQSEARVNRIIRVDPDQVRRTGGQLSEHIFREVAAEVRKHC